MSNARVIRVNEQLCGRCGRGIESGYPYPSCAPTPDGYTRDEAHRVFCTRFANNLCGDCEEAS